MGEHVLEEEELAVADARQAGAETAGRRLCRARRARLGIALPIFAVGRVGDEVVEVLYRRGGRWRGCCRRGFLGVAAVGGFHIEVGLAHGEGLGVDFLAEDVDVGAGVDGRLYLTVVLDALRDVVLGDGEHAAGAAAGVVDGEHLAGDGDAILIAGEKQVDHEVHDVAGGKVLAGVFVEGFVEFADELLEDGAHGGVVDLVGMQIDGC